VGETGGGRIDGGGEVQNAEESRGDGVVWEQWSHSYLCWVFQMDLFGCIAHARVDCGDRKQTTDAILNRLATAVLGPREESRAHPDCCQAALSHSRMGIEDRHGEGQEQQEFEAQQE